MKATGMIRPVDGEGRVVLPIELRRMLDIEMHDPLEFFVDGNSIILGKYETACILCNKADRILQYKGKNFCADCLKALKRL